MSSRHALAALSPDEPATNDLAEGFASHVVQWAAQTGAPTDSLAVLAAALAPVPALANATAGLAGAMLCSGARPS